MTRKNLTANMSSYTKIHTLKEVIHNMVRKDGAEARKERLQKVATTIQASLHKQEGSIPLSKTIAALQYDLGLTRERTMEYLDILEKLGQFILDNDNDRITKKENS